MSKQSGKLQGISVFKDLRSETEVKIYELLNKKIDELLDLESFNWLMTESQGRASDYMRSLLTFLKDILSTFNTIPVNYNYQFQFFFLKNLFFIFFYFSIEQISSDGLRFRLQTHRSVANESNA